MNLLPLKPADADAVARLWYRGAIESAAIDSNFFPATSPERYAEGLRTDLEHKRVLGWGIFGTSPEGLVAYLTAKLTDPSPDFVQERFLYLLDLDVDRDHRRRGLGRTLVAAARAFAKDERIASVEVSWLSEDLRASAFWASLGFAPYLARARSS